MRTNICSVCTYVAIVSEVMGMDWPGYSVLALFFHGNITNGS